MLSFLVTGPIILAVLVYLLPSDKAAKAVAIPGQLALACASVYLFTICKREEIVVFVGGFNPVMGITLKADTLASVFVLLVSFIFLIVSLYNLGEDDTKLSWFFLYIWQGLLNGIFLSRDMFNLFILLEIVTVVVSVMIMFNRDKRSMYDGVYYLMVNTVAIQFYLLGMGYLYKLTGTLDMDIAAKAVSQLDPSSLLLPYALIMTTISMKCALAPLFGWLPKAHGAPGAPSAVSAILSGLHIKSGIYLFIRFRHVFSAVHPDEFFLVIGIITGIAGFILSLSQSDIKLILAYSTISQIGIIMTGLSLNNSYSYIGAVYHIVNHALFKSALFLSAGLISHTYHTREIDNVRGVFRRTPILGAATILAILGITGAPFFNGSVSKYFIASGAGRLVSGLLMFNNLGTITIFIKYSATLFGRHPAGHREDARLIDDTNAYGAANARDDTNAYVDTNAYADTNLRADTTAYGDANARVDTTAYTSDKKAGRAVSARQQVAILIPALLCFITGLSGQRVIHVLFNVSVGIDAAGYLKKALIFFGSVAVGLVIYTSFIRNGAPFRRDGLFARVKSFSIGFRGMCALTGAYFAILLIVASVMIK